jgi:hypothetical protein
MRLREGERGSVTATGFQVSTSASKQVVGSYQIHMNKLDKIYNLRPIVSNTTKIAPQILEASNLRKQGMRQAEKSSIIEANCRKASRDPERKCIPREIYSASTAAI